MRRHRRGHLRIGTSGYQYDHWRGVLYPRDLPRKDWFGFYAEHFDTVEINNTFYHLPSRHTFKSWYRAAPPGFCYVLKYSRYGSHIKRLKDPRGHVKTFLDVARELGAHLGPILVQLPPKWHVDVERLKTFLKVASGKARWAIEFRDPRWLCEDVYRLMRKYHAALCVHDLIEDHPREITADWVYLRYHGDGYGGTYSRQRLAADASRIAAYLDNGLDVFAFFNNDREGFAVSDALDLRRYVKKRRQTREPTAVTPAE